MPSTESEPREIEGESGIIHLDRPISDPNREGGVETSTVDSNDGFNNGLQGE